MERKHAPRHAIVRSRKGKVTRSTLPMEMSRELGIVTVKGHASFPMIADQNVFQQRFRFKRTTAGMATVTADCLTNLMFVARGSSTGTRLFQFARLMKVEVWGDQAANPGTSPNAVTLTFFAVNPDSGHQDRTASFQDVGTYDRMAHICVRPGLLNAASRPLPSDSTDRWSIFATSGQIGDVVDVVVEFSLFNPALGTPSAIATASTSAGQIYANANLDNTNLSGTQGNDYLTSLSSWSTAVGYG